MNCLSNVVQLPVSLTGIELCETSDFGGALAGFKLYLDNGTHMQVGCDTGSVTWPYETVNLREGEIVIGVDVHHFRNNNSNNIDVVIAMTFHTNVQTYGPFGDHDASLYTAELRGYNLQGLYGNAQRAIDSIGAVFQLCGDEQLNED